MNLARPVNLLAKVVWFRPGTVRKAWFPPYAGLRFELSPQIFPARMCIFRRGCEKEVSSELKRRLHPGSEVAIVGAHVGMHVLHAAKLLGGRGKVFAFEPWPQNFEALTRNLRFNQEVAATVTPINKAVGGESGWAQMTAGPSDGEHHLADAEDGPGRSVPITTLDDELRDVRLDLLLVDVEGRESDVLKGAAAAIDRGRPVIILEHHGRRPPLIEQLERMGYSVAVLGDRHLIGTNPTEAGGTPEPS